MARILLIDDDRLVCQSLSLVAKRKGHEVVCTYSKGEGLTKGAAEDFDLVFLDVRLPDGNGLDIIPQLKNLPSAPEIIIITGYGDPQGAELAIKNGVWDYLEKGASYKETTLSLQRALQYRKQNLAETVTGGHAAMKRDGIVGASPGLEACLEQVVQAAASDASVLITGETGTGKELFARAIHLNSPRSKGNFVVVDCAALPENLIESILFGHQKGVYTGADHAREGLILQANGGTLFLDEIGEMPLSLQKTFLRVLQDHRFRPLGSVRELESDFRLVAATNRNLEAMANAQPERFRGDLLFRLRSFLIELPSLRECPEDLKTLARHYTDRICEHYGIPTKSFSPDFLKTLAAYRWPGNVRELVNTFERTIAAARGETILFPKHLPIQLRIEVAQNGLKKEPVTEQNPGHNASHSLPRLQEFRDSVYSSAERQYLLDLIAIAGNDMGGACKISGLSPSRLYALLKKQGISLHPV